MGEMKEIEICSAESLSFYEELHISMQLFFGCILLNKEC
ncbi:hypothetical protein BOVAC2_722 [Bacteroides ovatus]|nr:hypothetical protein BOVAC2_722 [Bacteroides ovatus]